MAIAVTAVEAFGQEVDEPGTSRFEQTLILYTTGLVADVTYDIGAAITGALGTFWTQALADGANGATAATALKVLQSILPLIKNYIGAFGPVLAVKTATVTLVNNTANLAFTAGQGPTTGVLIFKYDMKPGKPVKWPIVP